MRSLKLILVFWVTLAGGNLLAQGQKLDPAAWGGNHVGKPAPEFYGGDECLFCHRFTVGQVWQKDSHFRSVRGKFKDGKDSPEIVFLQSDKNGKKAIGQFDLILGFKRMIRLLSRNDEGGFDLTPHGILKPGTEEQRYFDSRWGHGYVGGSFTINCIGCHMTGVDQAKGLPFESFVGCEPCHGPHHPAHTNGTTVFMRFAKKAKETPQMIASTCGSCHLRGGESKSTGRPYPNNFISGDNLFKDFNFDFGKADNPKLNPPNLMDMHIQRNIRDIVVNGQTDLTCLSCHKMHPSDTLTHRRRARTDYCFVCHQIEPFKDRKPYEVHSAVCEY
jgi:hypothetical protein